MGIKKRTDTPTRMDMGMRKIMGATVEARPMTVGPMTVLSEMTITATALVDTWPN